MSTQNSDGFLFSIRPEEQQQQFRLLELPPELLSQLTSDQPPTLRFKSSEGPAGQPLDSTAVLCTTDHTFNIRQVNHSNSVYIAQTTSNSAEDELARTKLEAIASTGFVLELLPSQPASAAPFIKKLLPIWTSGNTAQSQSSPLTKQNLFANIPLSDAECQQSWTDLACFEINDQSYLPSAALQVEAWNHILSTMLAEGIDPLSPLSYTSQDMIRTAVEETTELPPQVINAILSAVSDPSETLDHDKCILFIGLNLLASQRQISVEPLLSQWKDLVPEKWREDVKLGVISPYYSLSEDSKTVTFKDPSSTSSTSAADGTDPSATTSKTATKRKWHEKFRAQKKTS